VGAGRGGGGGRVKGVTFAGAEGAKSEAMSEEVSEGVVRGGGVELVTFGSFFVWPTGKGKGKVEGMRRPARVPPSMVAWCSKW